MAWWGRPAAQQACLEESSLSPRLHVKSWARLCVLPTTAQMGTYQNTNKAKVRSGSVRDASSSSKLENSRRYLVFCSCLCNYTYAHAYIHMHPTHTHSMESLTKVLDQGESIISELEDCEEQLVKDEFIRKLQTEHSISMEHYEKTKSGIHGHRRRKLSC